MPLMSDIAALVLNNVRLAPVAISASALREQCWATSEEVVEGLAELIDLGEVRFDDKTGMVTAVRPK